MDRVPAEADVVIVGGGVAGLTCAVGLLGSGLRIVVLERDLRLGGRARSWDDPTTGDPVHIGPHIVTDCYPNFFALLDRLGTRDRVVWQAKEVVYAMVEGARRIDLRRSRLPPPIQFASTLRDDPGLSDLDLLSNTRALRVAMGMDEADIRELDALDGETTLAALGVRPAMIRRYWAFAAESILNTSLGRCSGGALLRGFREACVRDAARVGFPNCGLGDLFVPAATAMLTAAGHTVCAPATVAAIEGSATAVTGVRLADGTRIAAKHVVAALPPAALAAVLPAEWRRREGLGQLEWFTPVPYVSVYLWLDRRVTDLQFWARTHDPDDLTCDWYDYANIYPGSADRGSLLATNIILAASRAMLKSDAEIVAAVREELNQNLPAARDAAVKHSLVRRIPLAVVAPRPGFEARRPAPRTDIDGLVLAGDWTRTELPSSMESAAASGWRAAELITGRDGLVRALPRPGRLARVGIAAARRMPWPRRLRVVLGA